VAHEDGGGVQAGEREPPRRVEAKSQKYSPRPITHTTQWPASARPNRTFLGFGPHASWRTRRGELRSRDGEKREERRRHRVERPASTCGARGSAGPVSRQSRQSRQSWQFCTASLAQAQLAHLHAGHLLRAAVAAGARHHRTARGGGRDRAQQQGQRRARPHWQRGARCA